MASIRADLKAGTVSQAGIKMNRLTGVTQSNEVESLSASIQNDNRQFKRFPRFSVVFDAVTGLIAGGREKWLVWRDFRGVRSWARQSSGEALVGRPKYGDIGYARRV